MTASCSKRGNGRVRKAERTPAAYISPCDPRTMLRIAKMAEYTARALASPPGFAVSHTGIYIICAKRKPELRGGFRGVLGASDGAMERNKKSALPGAILFFAIGKSVLKGFLTAGMGRHFAYSARFAHRTAVPNASLPWGGKELLCVLCEIC